MRTSSRTTSTGSGPSSSMAARPLAASPATLTSSPQSASSSRMRERAGASSSTISTLSGLSASLVTGHRSLVTILDVGHDDVHLIGVRSRARRQVGLRVEVEGEALADVGERHLVARMALAAGAVRVAQHGVKLLAGAVDADRDDPRLDARLDAM